MATGVGNVSIVTASVVMRGNSGIYTCSATNIIGDHNTTINVNVHCKKFSIV